MAKPIMPMTTIIGEVELVVGEALVDGGTGAFEESPLDLDVGVIGKFLLQEFAGPRGRGRGAFRIGPVVDADRGIADMDDKLILGACRCCRRRKQNGEASGQAGEGDAFHDGLR